jgi:hypothetical protein
LWKKGLLDYKRYSGNSKGKYGVEYSQKQIGVMLQRFNIYHSKAYVLDYRRPQNAEVILEKSNRSDSRRYWSR